MNFVRSDFKLKKLRKCLRHRRSIGKIFLKAAIMQSKLENQMAKKKAVAKKTAKKKTAKKTASKKAKK